MRETGAPSTGECAFLSVRAPPPGIVMVSPLEVPRNAEGAQCEGRAKEDVATRRGQGHYRGWGPTPSFAAAREPYPSRGLLQRCYMSVFRG